MNQTSEKRKPRLPVDGTKLTGKEIMEVVFGPEIAA